MVSNGSLLDRGRFQRSPTSSLQLSICSRSQSWTMRPRLLSWQHDRFCTLRSLRISWKQARHKFSGNSQSIIWHARIKVGDDRSSRTLYHLLWYPSQSRWPSCSSVYDRYLAIICELESQRHPSFCQHYRSTDTLLRHLLASVAPILVLAYQDAPLLVCSQKCPGPTLLDRDVHLVCHGRRRIPRHSEIALEHFW